MNPAFQILSIAFFRGKAEDLPVSVTWLVLAAAAAVVVSYIGNSLVTNTQPLVIATASIAIYSGFVYLMLRVNDKPERFIQAITGILGANTCVEFFAIPLLRSGIDIQNLTLSTALPLIVIRLWGFAISVAVLKDALEVRLGQAILIAFGCQAAMAMGVLLLFPAAGMAE